MMQVYNMKNNFFEKMMCTSKNIICRAKIKVALNQLKDWFNQQSYDQYADYQNIDERIREHRLKYEKFRFLHLL